MAVFYVDFVNGSNSWGGQGPDSSHTNQTFRPWKTLLFALGATSGFASGDTLILAPVAFRERITDVAMTSPTAETKVIGDPLNASGFRDAFGVLLDAGPVRVTAFTTDDKTAAATGALIILNAKDFFTFEKITFISGFDSRVVDASITSSTNITFRNCAFFCGATTQAGLLRVDMPFGVAANWLIENCIFYTNGGGAIAVNHASGTGADWDLNIVIRNCILITTGSTCVNITQTGGSANKAGGVKIINCFIQSRDACVATTTGGSTEFPNYLFSSIMFTTQGAVISAQASGQIIEDYNLVQGQTLRTNVASGLNSKGNGFSPHFELGQSLLYGFTPRPAFGPTIESPLIGLGQNSSGFLGVTGDLLGRPRPAGGGRLWGLTGKSFGPYEFHDFGVRDTGVKDISDSSLRLIGRGDHEYRIPLNVAQNTLSIKCRYNSLHGTGEKPVASILAAGELGIPYLSKTGVTGVDTWETLTFSPIEPNKKSWITLRLESRSTGASGSAWFDTLAIATGAATGNYIYSGYSTGSLPGTGNLITGNLWINFESGAHSGAMTPSYLDTNAIGDISTQTWRLEGASANAFVITGTGNYRPLSSSIVINGTTYNDTTGIRGCRFNHSGASNVGITLDAPYPDWVTFACWWKSDIPDPDLLFGTYDYIALNNFGGGWAVFQSQSWLGSAHTVSGGVGDGGGDITLQRNTPYWVVVRNIRYSGGYVDIYSTGRSLIGSSFYPHGPNTSGTQDIEFGNHTPHGDFPTGFVYYDNIIIATGSGVNAPIILF